MIYKKIDLHCIAFCFVSEEVAMEYIDYRILKKKPLTQGGFNRAMNQAAQCTCTPDEAILLTMDCGWAGVTPEYVAAELKRRFDASVKVFANNYTKNLQHNPNDSRTRTLEQDLTDRSWAN